MKSFFLGEKIKVFLYLTLSLIERLIKTENCTMSKKYKDFGLKNKNSTQELKESKDKF